MNRIGNKRGTSIVEVLVVMVILFVGILVILQLFPPGFLSVRRAESMTFASRLAQFEIERWKNNAENLPEGILPVDSTGAVLNDLFPGPPINDTNATAFRRVIGETTRIPFGGWDGASGAKGCIYILAYGPIDTTASMAVRGGNLTRRVGDGSYTYFSTELKPFQYGIDYGGRGVLPKVCFNPSSAGKLFYVSCSWWEDTGSGTKYHTATSIPVTATTTWVTLNIPGDPTKFNGLDEESDTCCRGFVNLPTASAWSSDPYEYKLIDPTLGVIEFNPVGYAQTEFGKHLEAKIDYTILDPQIIHEDKRVPNNADPSGNYEIDLTLHRILPNPMSLWGVPVAAVDLETGCLVTNLNSMTPKDFRNGVVWAPGNITLAGYNGTFPAAGRNLRFFYKADGDWSVQFMKAYCLYERADAAPLDYKSYYIDRITPSFLWFAGCNGTHSVAVDYEYVDQAGNIAKAVGENYRISDDPNVITSWVHIELKHTPTRIFSVAGSSVRARVVWRDGELWRNVDLDTTLVRGESESGD